jgi:hypothetical protein
LARRAILEHTVMPEGWAEPVAAVPFLCRLWRASSNAMWLLKGLLVGIAVCIESCWGAVGEEADPLAADQVGRGRRHDPDVDLALDTAASGPGSPRNKYMMTRLARAIGKQLQGHRARKDHALAMRYLHACRRAFKDATTLAMAVDATRFLTNEGCKKTGKDKLAGVLLNVDTQVACWGPPQVSQGTAQRPPPSFQPGFRGTFLQNPLRGSQRTPFGVPREPWPTGFSEPSSESETYCFNMFSSIRRVLRTFVWRVLRTLSGGF